MPVGAQVQLMDTLIKTLVDMRLQLNAMEGSLDSSPPPAHLNGQIDYKLLSDFVGMSGHFEHLSAHVKDLHAKHAHHQASNLPKTQQAQLRSGNLKLQLGASEQHAVKGWISLDAMRWLQAPKEVLATHLQAALTETSPIPFLDDSCQFVFAGHFLEHMPFVNAASALTEVLRVLQPGGTVRIVVPDALAWLEAHVNHREALWDYVKNKWNWWNYNKQTNLLAGSSTGLLMSYFGSMNGLRGMLSHQHQAGYDFELLKNLLERVGFVNVKRCRMSGSDFEELKAMDTSSSVADGAFTDEDGVQYELSLFVEAQAPL